MTPEEKDNISENETIVNENQDNTTEENTTVEENNQKEEDLSPEAKLQIELSEMKDKYLRLYSEFDNFRKRTNKEKLDLTLTAGADIISNILPVLDDFERAMKALGDKDENKEVLDGVNLVYQKLYKTLENKGLKPMNATGTEFNPEIHEAITQIPSPSEDMKGKVIDEIEKGYYLHEKVIRFAKVVTGA